MTALFLNLLRTSLVIGILSCVIALLSPFWNRKFSALWKKWLWSLLAAMLLIGSFVQMPDALIKVKIPVSNQQVQLLKTEQGATNVPITNPQNSTDTKNFQKSEEQELQSPLDNIQGVGSSQQVPTPIMNSVEQITVMEFIWLIGMTLFLLWLISGEFLFSFWVRSRAKPVESNHLLLAYQTVCNETLSRKYPKLLCCPQIGSPMLMGFIHPKLLIPAENYSTLEATYIFRHELAHWQNHDLWWKLLLFVVNTIHWFNPAVWLLRWEANRDIERACDERVVQDAPIEDRKIYSDVLLSSIRKGHQPALSTHFYGGAKTMKERLQNILTGKKRRGAALTLIFALLAVCLIPMVACTQNTAGSMDATSAQNTGMNPSGDPYTFLLIGTTADTGSCDTIMVLSYATSKQDITLMSIPRDTMVNVAWDAKRLNSVYSYYGGGENGTAAMKQEVSELLGFEPDYTITVECEGFSKLVDALGGVPFDVPVAMNYDDPAQSLSIHLKKGYQTLDGNSAAGLIRWRKNNDLSGYPTGDLDRMNTQQAFVQATIEQLLQIQKLTKAKELSQILKENVKTDLTTEDIFSFAKSAISGGVTSDKIACITMPYEAVNSWSQTFQSMQSYVVPKADELVDTVNQFFTSDSAKITLHDMDIMSVDAEGNIHSTTGILEDSGIS